MESGTSKRIEVAIADSNPLMLSALAEYFEDDRRFSLVATTKTAEAFLESVLRVPVKVGVVDWVLPVLGAERLIEVLREQEHGPRVVVYAHGYGVDVARRAMTAGAAGFCSRDDPPQSLLDTVAEVASGRMVFPFLDIRVLRNDPMHALTKRERDLLNVLAQGLTNKQLADQFDISENTIKFHLRNLFDKLGVRNRAQAIAYYYKSSHDPRAP